MKPNACVARRLVDWLMVILAVTALNQSFGQDEVIPIPGKITFIRLSAPDQPDRVEEINLSSGEIKQVVRASPERSSIRSFCISPDGKQCLFEMGSGANWYENNEIFRRNTKDGSVRRVTDNGIYDGDPAWSLDGVRLAFTRGWGVRGRVYLRELASDEERPLPTPGLIIARDAHWLTESKLLVVGYDAEKRQGLVELDINNGSVRWLLKGQVDYLCLSPDRQRLACVVQKERAIVAAGESEWLYSVNILTLATATLKPLDQKQTMFERDVCPIWSHDGKKLSWIRNDRKNKICKLVVYDIETGEPTSTPLSHEDGADAGSLVGAPVVWAPDDSMLACVLRDQHRTKYNLRVLVLSTGTIRDIFNTADQIQCLYWK